MTRRRGLLDRDIQPRVRIVDRLGDAVDLTVGGPGDEDALIDALDGMDVLVTTSRLPVTARVLGETDLAVVAKIGTGLDNLDLEAAERLGVPVTYTPGANATSVAEHTLGLLLAVTHRIGQTRDLLRRGGWRDEAPLGTVLSGKTVGIVGFGNVGRRVATLLSGFHVDVLAYDPYVDVLDTEPAGASLVGLDRVLEASDAVCVNAELTAETRGMIGATELASMQPTAVLVNTARGPIVDTDALVAALETGGLAGAGLDVYETEPLPSDSPLLALDTVVATPHVAAASWEARERGIDLLATHVLALLDGRDVPPRYLGTPDR